jgi:hypothetical protein
VSIQLDRLAALVAGTFARPWREYVHGDMGRYPRYPDASLSADIYSRSESEYDGRIAGGVRIPDLLAIVALMNVAGELIAVARAAEAFDAARRAMLAEGTFSGPEVDVQQDAVRTLFDALHALDAKLAEGGK